MTIIIIKNNSGSDQDILDLGITIEDGTQRNLTDEFTLDEIDGSQDLYNLVDNGTLVVNDGTQDLSASDGVKHISLITDYEDDTGLSSLRHDQLADIVSDPSSVDDHDTRYYTKAELQATGGSHDKVDWSHIQNAPAMGAPSWKDPVNCRVEQRSSNPPSNPQEGWFYFDTDDEHLYKYVSGAWVDQGAPQDGDGYIDKTDDKIYYYTNGAWDTGTVPEENDTLLVHDDGDGKAAQYIYNGSAWVKVSDVDWGDHGSLQGLDDDDHPQYHNDARGDARYYRKTEFIDSSSGSSDAGKPIVLDSDGKIDESMIDETDIDHGGLSGLGDDDHPQYLNNARGDARYYQKSEFISSSSGSSDAGKPIVLDSDGKIDASMVDDSDIDHGNLTGLGDDDHPQYLNNARHDAISGNVHDVKLDDAYDGESGSGSGRIVDVDSGPVKLDASNGTDAPLELTPLTSNPTTNLSAGQLMVKNNLLYIYDDSRSKWLSVQRVNFLFGRGRSNQYSQYLRCVNGAPSSVTGYRVPRDATITAISVQTQNNANANFRIRKNGSHTNLGTLSLSGVSGAHATNLNIDIDAGDYIQIYMQVTSGNVDYPELFIELAYR
ncbi:MAG: hypothetical protein DRH04_02045 [Deltaproteobacteria bacterium]|nr:MAG: hypothetical protein DRH04_02045 [Deltaproteobacteria bacterium]